mgnify:CR=1 FL=1
MSLNVSKNGIKVGQQTVEYTENFKLLGVHFQHNLLWSNHIIEICKRANNRLVLLRRLKRAGFDINELLMYYKLCIRPVIEYACPVWHTMLTKDQTHQLEIIQKRALLTIFSGDMVKVAAVTTDLSTLHDRCETLAKNFFNKLIASDDIFIQNCLPKTCYGDSRLRKHDIRLTCACRTSIYSRSLIPYGIRHWK